jgi:hypothetical protein
MSGGLLFGRYDNADVGGMFGAEGIFEALRRKGFSDFEIDIDDVGRTFPHTRLYAAKGGRHMLLDACLREATVRPDLSSQRAARLDRPVELIVVHWVQEHDPTADFPPDRPRLLLQLHPGLGILRRAFRVVARMAVDLGKDGVANTPKFFHDALIFYRSRLFLFFDGREQGRFEALARDLKGLPLSDASLAVIAGCVRDSKGETVRWSPGYQVFPLRDPLTSYFNSPAYASEVTEAVGTASFSCDTTALAAVREAFPALTQPDLPE